jgi:hypothetical protein
MPAKMLYFGFILKTTRPAEPKKRAGSATLLNK